MTKYLLDTDTIEYLSDTSSPFHHACLSRLEDLGESDELCVSVLSLYEMEYSIAGASLELKPRLERSKQKVLKFYTILPLTTKGSEYYGEVKQRLKLLTTAKPRKMKTFTVDMMILSTALEHEAILVSNDAVYLRTLELEMNFQHENWAK